MGMSEFYSGRDDAESTATLHWALDLGVTFLDTADMYGMGENERLIGQAIKDRRDQVMLATKFGKPCGTRKNAAFRGINGKPEYVRQACDASLQRLGVNHIDLYYQHRVDPATPIEDTVGAMAELVQQGKVRFLGPVRSRPADTASCSGRSPHCRSAGLSTHCGAEIPKTRSCRPVRELGIGFVPYSPLGRGFLTGQIKTFDDLAEDDYRRHSPPLSGKKTSTRISTSWLESVKSLVRKAFSRRSLHSHGCWPRVDDIVPIPGTKRRAYLEENLGALGRNTDAR